MPWKTVSEKEIEKSIPPAGFKPKRARFLVDENLGEETAEFLRDHFKLKAVFASHVGLDGRDDQYRDGSKGSYVDDPIDSQEKVLRRPVEIPTPFQA